MKSQTEIEQSLKKMLSRYPQGEIIAALLFGSVATNRGNEESDVDIAVLFSCDVSGPRRQDLLKQIYEDLPYYFIEPVDIVTLNDADLILTREILSKEKLLLCTDPVLWKEFRNSRWIQYLDYRKSLEKYYPQLAS